MEHVDPDILALVALGEPAPDADRAHVEACERCGDEVAALAAAVAAGRAGASDGGDALVPPAPQVWTRIAAELGLGGDGSGTSPAEATPTALPAADVVPLRRRRTAWLVTAAAAAGLVLGGTGVGLWQRADDDGSAQTLVAEAALDPLPGWDARGDAKVERSADGRLTLVLTLTGAADDGGFHEVWLIDRDVTRLISLGVVEGDSGRFALPSGLDLADFPVVDVSEEPYDGNPAHSGDSIIRGVLDV